MHTKSALSFARREHTAVQASQILRTAATTAAAANKQNTAYYIHIYIHIYIGINKFHTALRYHQCVYTYSHAYIIRAVLLAIVVAERTGDVDVFVCACVCWCVVLGIWHTHTHIRRKTHERFDVCACVHV